MFEEFRYISYFLYLYTFSYIFYFYIFIFQKVGIDDLASFVIHISFIFISGFIIFKYFYSADASAKEKFLGLISTLLCCRIFIKSYRSKDLFETCWRSIKYTFILLTIFGVFKISDEFNNFFRSLTTENHHRSNYYNE